MEDAIVWASTKTGNPVDMTETWRELISEAMGDDDCWENVVSIAV